VQANITTAGNDIAFNTDITLNNSIVLTTGTGNGDISLASITGTGSNLTMSAETGNITILGTTGSGAFGTVIITSANNVTFEGAVNAVSFTQQNGTGTTVFESTQNYLAGFSFTGSALTINAELNTDTDTANNDGAISINNSGLFTVGPAGSISPNGANGKLTVTGNTLNNGVITAGAVPGGYTIEFHGNYTSSAAGILTGTTVSPLPEILFGANVALGIFNQNDNTIVFDKSPFTASTTEHILSIVAPGSLPILDNVIIKRGNKVIVFADTNIRQESGKTLVLEAETDAHTADGAILDVSEGSWHMGNGTVQPYSFAGFNGTVELGIGTNLINRHLYLNGVSAGAFTIQNSGRAVISVKGDAEIADGTVVFPGNLPLLILEMAGNNVTQNLNVRQIIGSFHVKNGSLTILNNNLGVRGEVVIEYSETPPHGILDAGSYNVTLYAALNEAKGRVGRWKIINAPETVTSGNVYTMHAFRQNTGGSVTFADASSGGNVVFEVLGNTTWQKFICQVPGAFIQFSKHPHQHVFLYTFEVNVDEAVQNDDNYITLTRYIESGSQWVEVFTPNNPLLTPPPYGGSPYHEYGIPMFPASRNLKGEPDSNDGNGEKDKFWNINLIPEPSGGHHQLMNIFHVAIYFSHAWYQRIPVASGEMDLKVVPYYRLETGMGYFNYDWIEVRRIIYSFAEDSSGNGKVDRIRVQSNVPLNEDFSKFMVEVEGFTVTGFGTVMSRTGDIEDNSSFYIFLEEGRYLYDGQPLKWHVTRNESLYDLISQSLVVGHPDDEIIYTTINTIPPRISYVLTLPGHNQTFIQMSQPVSSYNETVRISGTAITPHNHEISALTIVPKPPYLLEYYSNFTDIYYLKEAKGAPGNSGVFNYLVELNREMTVSELAALPVLGTDVDPNVYFSFVGLNGFGLRDLGVRALDWNDETIDPYMYMYYPSPRYPIDWNYSGYATYIGNSHVEGLTEDDPANPSVFLPPNELLTPQMMRRLESHAADAASGLTSSVQKITPGEFPADVTRRSTDVLVSMLPSDSVPDNNLNYFAWPVWARLQPQLNTSIYPDDIFWGQQLTDTGIIWEFDGTKYLEARGDIDLQARVNSSIAGIFTGSTGLELLWATNIPAELRNPQELPVRGRGPGGLWLPANNLLYNLTPTYNGNEVKQSIVPPLNFPLFNFVIDGLNSGSKLEFIFRISNSDMYITRLEAPAGVIPVNWYTLLRPFSFDIQNIRLQRGGVTILNNVINSTNREVTFIRYHLVRSGRVTVQIYTLDGTLVRSIRRNELREAGEYTDAWDGTNNGGRPVARGMYFVRVVGPDIDEIRKIMVVR
jgi:hypothetical protein